MSYTGFENLSLDELEVEMLRSGNPAAAEYLRRIDEVMGEEVSEEELEEMEGDRIRSCFGRLVSEVRRQTANANELRQKLETGYRDYKELDKREREQRQRLADANEKLARFERREADRPATW